MSLGPWQILIIAALVLLLFGASRLGNLGKGLGEGIRNFKRGIKGDDDDPKAHKTHDPGQRLLKEKNLGPEE